jgi:acetyltransferase
VGRTDAGAKAAASHTGALAGSDAVFDGVIRGLGVTRARNEEHMLDIVEVLGGCKLPDGRGLGIVTQSGGAGVLMADRAEEMGLVVSELSPQTRAQLAAVIPAFGTTGNPVDVTGQFVSNPNLLLDSMRIMMSDPQVHVGIVWLQLMDAHVDRLVDIFAKIKDLITKPWIVCWVAAPEAALEKMRRLGIPVLRGADPAVDAVAALVRYAEARRNWLDDSPSRASLRLPHLDLPAQPGPVASLEGRALLQNCGVNTAAAELVATADDAVTVAEALGYPVALKIESPDILHKTEARGVELNLKDAAAVRSAFAQLLANARQYKPDARISGVLVQAMATGEVELVIGLKRDPVFGPVVMVGLGGVLIEVFKDVVFRAAPVTEGEALRMLNELKSRVVLDGVRGKPPVDKAALAGMISAVSRFAAAAGPRLAELDLNPVLAGSRGVTAVDWLMVFD